MKDYGIKSKPYVNNITVKESEESMLRNVKEAFITAVTLEYNTMFILYESGVNAIRFHVTDIVRQYPKSGQIVLNGGKHADKSDRTRKKIQYYANLCGANIELFRASGKAYIMPLNGEREDAERFEDNIIVQGDNKPLSKILYKEIQTALEEQKARAEREERRRAKLEEEEEEEEPEEEPEKDRTKKRQKVSVIIGHKTAKREPEEPEEEEEEPEEEEPEEPRKRDFKKNGYPAVNRNKPPRAGIQAPPAKKKKRDFRV